MSTKAELARAEDAGWLELMGLVESLTPDELQEPGYFEEGWSVKDLIAHIASWQAKTGLILEQISEGTFSPGPVDGEDMNRRFYDSNKDLPLSVVRAESFSARARMLTEWNALPMVTADAEEWFADHGPNHYAEHLPQLRQWVGELRSRR